MRNEPCKIFKTKSGRFSKVIFLKRNQSRLEHVHVSFMKHRLQSNIYHSMFCDILIFFNASRQNLINHLHSLYVYHILLHYVLLSIIIIQCYDPKISYIHIYMYNIIQVEQFFNIETDQIYYLQKNNIMDMKLKS